MWRLGSQLSSSSERSCRPPAVPPATASVALPSLCAQRGAGRTDGSCFSAATPGVPEGWQRCRLLRSEERDRVSRKLKETKTQGKGQGCVWACGCAPCSLLPGEGSASVAGLWLLTFCQACEFHVISHSTKNVIAQSLPHSTYHRLPRLTRFLLHACFSISFLPLAAFPFHPREQCGAELCPPALTQRFPCSRLLALRVLGLVLRYKRQQLRSISGNTAVIKPAVALGH